VEGTLYQGIINLLFYFLGQNQKLKCQIRDLKLYIKLPRYYQAIIF
jgi:hypothetical protein